MTTSLPHNDPQSPTERTTLVPKGREDRVSAQKGLIEVIMQPYTLVSLVLIGGGLAISFIDPKGLVLLLVAVVIVLGLRLGYTTRQGVREGNDLQRRTITLLQQQNALLARQVPRDDEGRR
ncbi:hypothetical protein [Deinococcus budaensis]|uniref:Uncharacterized protein n=1 Tax=Deinococcus budaensis TaxID=1665626 RepID=A0A7W8GI01_9DEIO|nr:hypothetical protein [Deinococcus budaensis]MBB5235990.1 hypothetical protein [Deinococcus budaensis]